MFEPLRALLVRADSLPERRLLWINLGIACVVALSHGGALASSIAKPAPEFEGIRQLATFSLPIAALVVLSAVAGLIRSDWRPQVLAFHGFVLAWSALVLLVWAVTLVVGGIPQGNFSWSVVLLSASVWYGAFVLRRFSLPDHLKTRPSVYYLPVIALSVAVPLDVGVFLRMFFDMGKHFGN